MINLITRHLCLSTIFKQTFVWSHTPAFFFKTHIFVLNCYFIVHTMFESYPKNLEFFGIFTNFCSIQSDLSGNTVWLQVSAFKILGIFDWLLCQRHFRWFSNPVRSWRTFLFYWGSLNLDFRRLIQEVRPPIKVTLIGFNVSPDDPALLLFCNQNSLTAWKYQAWNRSRSSSSMMNRCWLCPSWPHFFTSSLSKQERRSQG